MRLLWAIDTAVDRVLHGKCGRSSSKLQRIELSSSR